MDLGLSSLTDDQLLELVLQMCEELVQREPYVRNLAQGIVVDKAQLAKAKREEIERAIEHLAGKYRAEIAAEAAKEAKAAHEAGTLQLLPPAEEATAIVKAGLNARIALIDKAIAKLESEPADFAFEVRGNTIAVAFGDAMVEKTVSAKEVKRLLELLKKLAEEAQPAIKPKPEYPTMDPNRRFGRFSV